MTGASAAEPTAWSEKNTRLATEYLSLLVEKPEYGRVLDLLWDLYDKHDSTTFLLENIATQAKAQSHTNVTLVYAHLLRKAGKSAEAKTQYENVLKTEPNQLVALRALADLAQETGDKTSALNLLQKITQALPSTDPQQARLQLEIGKLLLETDQQDEAAKAWEKAIALQPQDTALLNEVAKLMIGAGLLDDAVKLYQRLAQTSDPVKRLDALFDLSRLAEQADKFDDAAKALQDGLALLHFKDWRYAQFFQRQVKLHERFDQLDALKAKLIAEAEKTPPQEQTLTNLVQFYTLIVDSDAQLRWLRELTQYFPASLEYRWQLATALMDHDGSEEAAKLLDQVLKNDVSDNTSLVLLRVLAHLRMGETSQAVARLKQLLVIHRGDLEVEKQVLTFAREKSLDEMTEHVLRERMLREPEKLEPAFELAGFYRARGQSQKLEVLFKDFARTDSPDKQRRLNAISHFYATGNDPHLSERAARAAAEMPSSGREEWLHLADVLLQSNNSDEALSLLERAREKSENTEQRTDVDERILSLLAGDHGTKNVVPSESAEFRLPAIFTGEGFGADVPEQKEELISEAVATYAMAQILNVLHSEFSADVFAGKAPAFLDGWLRANLAHLNQASPDDVYRAAWWCLRAEQIDLAYVLLRQLIFDANKQRVAASPDVEKLLLDVALADKNTLLILRQLRLLSTLDPENSSTYLLRLAEQEGRRENKRGLGEAVKILEAQAKENPQNEAILSALSQFYIEEGKRDEAMALWDKAVQQSKGNAGSLLERYAEILIAQRKFPEFIASQLKALQQEGDVKRRRELFKRALERLLWAEAQQGELSAEDKKQRLELMENALREQSRRQPFEGFWHEALAGVYERQGHAEKAFAAMKQAYYTAPETPFTLDQLRAAALRVGDVQSAIYFQKQVAATATSKEEAGEWRQLVQLLESDFRMGEADQARRRLEARFSQDPVALEELAKYYTGTAQDEAARRVLEQLSKIRSWEAKSLLSLALQQKRLGDKTAARESLTRLLSTVPKTDFTSETPVEKWPWPLLEERPEVATSPTVLLNDLENAPGLEQPERDRLRAFLSLPRSEFSALPEEPGLVRLRAVEEYVKLHATEAPNVVASALTALHLSEMELSWMWYFLDEDATFQQILHEKLSKEKALEPQFIYAWLGVKSCAMKDVLAWVKASNVPEAIRRQRKGLLQAVVNILADDSTFRFEAGEVVLLGKARLLSNTELIDLARKCENRRLFDLAISFTEAAQENAPSLGADYALYLARLAEFKGDARRERHYLRMVWEKPIEPGKPSSFDPFMQSLTRLVRLAETSSEREDLLQESWRRLEQLPVSGQGELRKARLLGIAGASDLSVARFSDYLGDGLLTARPFAEPIMGRLLPGTPANSSANIDVYNHLRSYWDDLREWGETTRQDGLATELVQVENVINLRNGGTSLGPRGSYEFSSWRNNALARQLRFATHLERVRLIREFLESDTSVETLIELGSFLESQGYPRECIEIYRGMPDRAPSNNEYCEQLLRVCENSWESAIAIPYIEKILVAEPQMKPQGISEETLRDKHARFIGRLHDFAKLRPLAFRGRTQIKIVPGRTPEEVPYLKELAMLLERYGDKPGALAAWEELFRLWPEDMDASLHRAQLLHHQGNNIRSLEALRLIPLTNFWGETVREAFALRAKLAADAGQWDEIRLLMNLVTGGNQVTPQGSNVPVSAATRAALHAPQTSSILALSRVLADHQRGVEAQNLLLRAERAAQENTERFQLRLEQLKLTASANVWSPAQDSSRIAALFRAETGDETALQSLRDFFTQEAKGPRAKDWIALLSQPEIPQNSLTALALSTFADQLNEKQAEAISKPWLANKPGQSQARKRIIEILLKHKRAAWAYAVATAGDSSNVVDSPLMVKILGALGQPYRLDELFARLVRHNYPGGNETIGYAEALIEVGRPELAEELYELAFARLKATAGTHPGLLESYTRYLLSQQRYEQAESVLMREQRGLTTEFPELLVSLYRGWKKLDRLEVELAKFQLPDGIFHQTLFLARSPQAPAP